MRPSRSDPRRAGHSSDSLRRGEAWVRSAVVLAVMLATPACARDAVTGEGARRSAFAEGDPLDPSVIRAVTARVADWQLDHPRYEPTDWTNAVFYAGVLAAHRVTREPRYLDVLVEAGERAGWKIGARTRHADDHAIAQTYLDLYRLEPEVRRIEDFRQAIDRMMVEPLDWSKPHQTIDYWWCDALFMSPPALAKLAAVTGKREYLDLADRLWRESYELLYDRKERLFHRDLRFRNRSEAEFWARGNGWVLAGLARLLDELPEDRPSRIFYESLFEGLAARVVELQGADGLWRSNLLAPRSGDPGESSASALLSFALAWGIGHGILGRSEYLPAVDAAWKGLLRNVDESGRLGWVQGPDSKPGRVSARHSEVYASGAFLLAAEQVLALEAS